MAASTLATHVTLAPSEYQGEPNTCVVGRVVIMRGPISLRRRLDSLASQPAATQESSAKGKGKGKKGKGSKQKKGNADEDRVKSEIHLLGGDTADEVLFGDAWAQNARDLVGQLELGKVYRIAGAKYVAKPPEYSTSRLTYFIRFEGRFGTQIKIEECTVSPWADAPLFHPLSDIATLSTIGSKMQTCIAGVITYQPGLVPRDTKFGPGEVCNAVIKQRDYDIRLGFWRDQGAALAALPVGEVRAFLQVNVVKSGESWECRATEATQIVTCLPETEAEIKRTTDQDCAGTSLTRTKGIDYDSTPTILTTLSALAGIIAPKVSREMHDVYELHNAAVLGVSAVLNDGKFKMKSCTECLRQVDGNECTDHPTAGTANRWIFSLELADGDTTLSAMLYNDAATSLPFLQGDADPTDLNPRLKQLIIRGFQAAPWSFRLVLKQDNLWSGNYVEIKMMTQTISPEGVVETYTPKKGPTVAGGRPGCPLARCADVKFDGAFGIVRCLTAEATAVRVVLKIEANVEGVDPDIAVPDPTGLGLRVCRKVSCVLDADDKNNYFLSASGVVGSVQWLLTAAAGTVFYVTAKVKAMNSTIDFRAVSFMDVALIGIDVFAKHMRNVLAQTTGALVEFTPSRATPQSRKRQIDEAAEWAGERLEGVFSKRRAPA